MTTRNEAPERLLVFEANLTPKDVETIREALAAERRATVERIEEAIKVIAENERYDLQYSREVTRLARDVRSHLDEEAAR